MLALETQLAYGAPMDSCTGPGQAFHRMTSLDSNYTFHPVRTRSCRE